MDDSQIKNLLNPRLDQLIVYSSVLEHLLQQKLHYEHERNMELKRLERFKIEGATEYRIKVQMEVVKRVEGMLPNIVFKMRNEYDKLDRFLHKEPTLRAVDVKLYNKSWKLLGACKENLQETI